MNKHPHAELMKLYAEDAMTTNKPWQLWVYRNRADAHWSRCTSSPIWSEAYEYKRSPKKVFIQGIGFHQPYNPSAAVDAEDKFYTISISGKGIVTEELRRHRANFEKFDDLHKRGLIFERLDDCETYINALTELNNKIICRFNEESGKED